jgi:DNA adenine methylase
MDFKMKYMGSKRRVAKEILDIMLKDRKPDQFFVDAFAGGMNLIEHVGGNRIANDINKYVIEMFKKVVNDGWVPPSNISEEEYIDLKKNQNHRDVALLGFVGVVCSFGTSWFRSYAKNSIGRNYCLEGKKGLLKQVDKLKGCIFVSGSYDQINIPENSIIYCDPPYSKTADYNRRFRQDDGSVVQTVPDFDHEKFWNWCRQMTNKGHKVYVSEYSAPNDFTCIWFKEINVDINNTSNKKIIGNKKIERLFIYGK